MWIAQYLSFLFILLLQRSLVSARLEARQQSSCSSYISQISALSKPVAASRACSTYLSYGATRTVTTTVTTRVPVTVATVTSTVTTSRTRTSFVTTETISTTIYETLTNTITSYYYETITRTSAYPAANKRRQAATPAPSPLNSLSLSPAALSRACSCYVPPPTASVTSTVTQTVTRSLTATTTTTSRKVSVTEATATVTDLDVQGVYTYVTEHPDSTLTLTVTTCSGRNPTASFNLQVADTTPTRTDSYNSLYPSPTHEVVYRNVFYGAEFLATQPSSKLFNIDCVGRLYVKSPDAGRVLFATVDILSVDFALVHFILQAEIEKRNYKYIFCNIVGGFLRCRAGKGSDQTMFQTCPIYDEFFDNALVIATYQSTDAPECFGLQFKVV